MGGMASGNWYRSDKKSTVEKSLTVAIRDFRGQLHPHSSGLITWNSAGGSQSTIRYFVTWGDGPTITLRYIWRDCEHVQIPIHLETTPTQFGVDLSLQFIGNVSQESSTSSPKPKRGGPNPRYDPKKDELRPMRKPNNDGEADQLETYLGIEVDADDKQRVLRRVVNGKTQEVNFETSDVKWLLISALIRARENGVLNEEFETTTPKALRTLKSRTNNEVLVALKVQIFPHPKDKTRCILGEL